MKTLIDIIDTTGEPDIITQILDNHRNGAQYPTNCNFSNFKTN